MTKATAQAVIKAFVMQTLERAVKTAAQTAVALIGADGLGLTSLGAVHVVQVAGLAALASVLTSIASAPSSPHGSPSLVEVAPFPPSEAVRALSRPPNPQ